MSCNSSEPHDPPKDANNVEPTPIEGLNPSSALPSSEIQKAALRSVQDVLSQHKALARNPQKARTLAVKLAKDAIFDVHVMKLCTPRGSRELPALPVVELAFLKKILLQ